MTAPAQALAPPPSLPVADAAPAPRPERLPVIDTVRGFALLGVCLVNATMFAQPFADTDLGSRPTNGPWDVWLERGMYLLAEGKFFPLFSLLFGLGLFLQSERASAEGRKVAGRFARRLAVLAGLGLAHGLLVWSGDILLSYALLGFLLLLFRNTSPRWLRVSAALSLSLTVGLLVAVGVHYDRVRADPVRAAELEKKVEKHRASAEQDRAEAYAAYRGSYVEALRYRANEYPGQVVESTLFVGPLVFSMFLTGLWVGRKRLLHAPAEHRAFLRRSLAVCGTLGLAASLGALLLHAGPRTGPPDLPAVAGMLLHFVGGAVLGYAYLCGLALLLLRAAWARRLAPLTAVGRMSVTNYLGQSVVGGFVYYGHGLGLFGKVGAGACLAIAAVLFTAQVAFSNFWMARFRMGPVEWAWRSLALWERQPLRRRPAVLA